ncbi:MAG: MBL fold metallo-hydrolase [Spirochaetota bacterium]|nr:MBL fold metallo-hydrolase [Spirochaetota bacterium]
MKTNLTHKRRFAIFFSLFLLFITYQSAQANKAKSLNNNFIKVYIIDVGQGDSILINLFNKKKILIDTGPKGKFYSFFFKEKRNIINFLNKNNIKKIDQLIISHVHKDHIGGLHSILRNIEINEVLDVGFAFPSKDYENCLKLIEKKKILYKIVRKGFKYSIDNVSIEIISPARFFKHTRSDVNSNSLVIKITYKNISFLFPGDIEKEAEYKILSLKNKLKSTFLKSPHHGSETSNTSEFIRLVQPKAVFISCGKNNIFGHPSQSTLEKYINMKIPVYRTDIHGTIEIITNGITYSINYKKKYK